MPSGSAYRPGDVLTAFGGRTVEVLNTDAEGRLVLADAIAYADAVLEPDQIIDVATLTGAARIALGGSLAALYSTSDELAATLTASGEASGDLLWRMPLVDDYRTALDSPVADIANVPRSGAGAGSITAALFLREFAGARPWAHLDIAGAARKSADEGELSAGGTGFGTRLLLCWLQEPAVRASEQPVAGRHQHRHEVIVGEDELAQLADRRRLRIAVSHVRCLVGPERVVKGHDAARTQQAERRGQVLRVLTLVGITEHQVIGAVSEPGQDLQSAAGDQPVASSAEAGSHEHASGQPVMLRLGVDRGQNGAFAHPAQQPQARGSATGPDLDNGARVNGGGQETQDRAGQRRHRDRTANSFSVRTGLEKRFVLNDEFVQYSCAVRAEDGCLRLRSRNPLRAAA
jgi:hypothetical protein